MKTLLIAFILLPLLVAGQSSEPFKKANTIVIETGLSPEEAFLQWGRHLVRNGYTISESSRDFMALTTGPKDTSKWNYDFIVLSTIEESGAVVLRIKRRQKSSVVANTRASEFFDWHYQGKADIFYQDVMPVVSSFGPYAVTYR